MNTNLFEYVTRNKIRFASARGELSAEQLWDVPLRSRDDFNLEAVAKAASKALREVQEETFVESARSAEHDRRETILDVIKYVIGAKLGDEKAAERRAKNRVEKERLVAILADKQAGKLSELTEKELQRRIAALDE
jgi:hypothetical protein